MSSRRESNVNAHASASIKSRKRLLAPQDFACPACGAVVSRLGARYCSTCGRAFTETKDYLPADTLRASYHGQYLEREKTTAVRATSVESETHATQSSARAATRSARNSSSNGAAQLALAFATYAVVPYLGILFCPGAIIIGFVGLSRAHRAPHAGGRRAAVASIVIGVLIFCAQIFLWWILYEIPQWHENLYF